MSSIASPTTTIWRRAISRNSASSWSRDSRGSVTAASPATGSDSSPPPSPPPGCARPPARAGNSRCDGARRRTPRRTPGPARTLRRRPGARCAPPPPEGWSPSRDTPRPAGGEPRVALALAQQRELGREEQPRRDEHAGAQRDLVVVGEVAPGAEKMIERHLEVVLVAVGEIRHLGVERGPG